MLGCVAVDINIEVEGSSPGLGASVSVRCSVRFTGIRSYI